MKIFVIVIFANIVFAQQDIEDALNTIFPRNSSFADFLDNYEEVTPAPLRSIGALKKCGEGDQKDRFVCVPYYNCNAATNTVQQNADIDGTNRIDIRMGEDENRCDHYLEICCQVSDNNDEIEIRVSTETPTQATQPTRPPTQPTRPPTQPTRPPTQPTIPSRPTSTEGGVITPSNSSKQAFCGIRNPKGLDFNLIGNSNEAQFGEFPWMVAILRKNQLAEQTLAICGGSLISPKVILTGAHCVHNVDVKTIKIRAGEWDTQTNNERIPFQERNVVQKIVHEYYSKGNLYNDLALLILERPLAKVDSVGTVCLPTQNQNFNSKDCLATGWGKDLFGQKGRYATILKKIQLPLVQNPDCQKALRRTRLGNSFTLHQSFICAGGDPGVDTCTGDGGSPLICPDPNNPTRYLQVGIVAWGIGCGEDQVPGVYVDVAKFRNWVDIKLQEAGISIDSYQ